MGRATRNPDGPFYVFPQAMSPPPGMAVLWVTVDMASHVYKKGTSTHNTVFTETASRQSYWPPAGQGWGTEH